MVSPTFLKGETEYLLGIMDEKGQGTRVNHKEAFDRFTKAIKCGSKKAENHLKLYYKDGNFIN
jgi:TPR repeat protein